MTTQPPIEISQLAKSYAFRHRERELKRDSLLKKVLQTLIDKGVDLNIECNLSETPDNKLEEDFQLAINHALEAKEKELQTERELRTALLKDENPNFVLRERKNYDQLRQQVQELQGRSPKGWDELEALLHLAQTQRLTLEMQVSELRKALQSVNDTPDIIQAMSGETILLVGKAIATSLQTPALDKIKANLNEIMKCDSCDNCECCIQNLEESLSLFPKCSATLPNPFLM